MKPRIQSFGRGLRSLLVPTRCPVCDRRVDLRGAVCLRCAGELERLRLPWFSDRLPENLLAAAILDGAVKTLIHRMKYEGQSAAIHILGELMIDALGEALAPGIAPVLVPVPLHRTRLRERGFNQAEALARVIGRTGRIPVRTDLIRRIRWSGSQTTFDARARRESVSGAFRLRRRPPAGRRLVLVDDVWTTGATTQACESVLLEGGADPPVSILVAGFSPLRLPD